jgi:hypothetical protein
MRKKIILLIILNTLFLLYMPGCDGLKMPPDGYLDMKRWDKKEDLKKEQKDVSNKKGNTEISTGRCN